MNKTKISWTDSTWNPWMGCHKVSAGCKYCYMFREQKSYGNDPNVVRRSKTKFSEPLKWKDARRVFTCSWSDWFIEEADTWRNEAWDIIKRTPHLTYQILTKRPQNIAARLPQDWGDGYPNVWLGTSTENQDTADERIPMLLQVPAVVRFLSCEPLLGKIDLWQWLGGAREPIGSFWNGEGSGVAWVIVGGESGPNFRPMNLDWARSIRDQCVKASVPFFFKQEAAYRNETNPTLDGVEWHQFPEV